MKRLIRLSLICACLLVMVGCSKAPDVPNTGDATEVGATTVPTTPATEPVVKENPSLSAVKAKIREAEKLFGVAYLGGFEGTAEEAKAELFEQEYLNELAFIKDVTPYGVMDGWQMYCIVPADDSVTLTVYEYVFADEPYKEKAILTANEPILLRGNVSDIVPNLCVVATKGDQAVEYTPMQSGMDGKLVNDDDKTYDFTPYMYMPQFGGVDRVPDAVFCGDWWTEAKDGNGEERSLILTLNPDGTMTYAYGIGNSEILEQFEGTWTLDSQDRLCISMSGGVLEGVDNPVVTNPYDSDLIFTWEITDEGLALTHQSGGVLLTGTNGETFVFLSMVG